MNATATTAYRAKRAVFDLLGVQAKDGFPLAGVQVTYATPGEASSADVFGAGVRIEQSDLSGEPNAMVVNEMVHLAIIVRVSDPNMTVRQSDAEVERIADALIGLFGADPWLDADQEMTVLGISSGVGDYEPSATWGRSMLAIELDVQCLIS